MHKNTTCNLYNSFNSVILFTYFDINYKIVTSQNRLLLNANTLFIIMKRPGGCFRRALPLKILNGVLKHSLCHHRLGNLHEAGHVGALHVVDKTVALVTVFDASFVDGSHDAL